MFKKIADQVARFFVGGLFIFSGLIKLNDPVGTRIKMEEYFSVFADDFGSFFNIFIPVALEIGMIMIILEIVLGVAVLIYYRMEVTTILLLAIMVFFTFLTFYSAYFNKVTDCGCFGDAIKLTPWQSFWKDIILMFPVLHLFWYRKTYTPVLRKREGHFVVGAATVVCLFLGIYAIRHLPFIDFRAYRVGNHIPSQMQPEEQPVFEYVFIEQAFGETTDQFFESDYANYNTPTALAYFNYLIGPRSILDPPGAEDEYFTDAGYPFQREDIRVNGASNQWSISYGGNVKDMFFFGGGIGITSLRYESQKIFTETFPANEPLQGFELVENLSIRGTGINATLGAIVRPVNFLQIGVSYTSPTFFGMTETYDASMSSRWDNFDYYGDGETILGDNSANPEETEIITSDYNFTAPMRLRGGLAFISQHGLITADVEMVNPSRAKYRARDDFDFISFEGDNADIRSIYKPAVNYRIGGEYRLNIFRFRAGYGIQTNSYSDSMEADNTVTSLSGGAGVRTKSFYIDLAVIHRAGKDYRYQPYTFLDGSGPVAELKDKSLMGIITVGFNF